MNPPIKTVALVVLSLFVLGCHEIRDQANGSQTGGTETVDYEVMLGRNRASLIKLSLGMDKAQVMNAMGTFQAKTNDGNVPNPAKSEMSTKGSDTYEILYYMTENYPPFTRIKNSQATPVVLKNGKVSGWGWSMANEVAPANRQ